MHGQEPNPADDVADVELDAALRALHVATVHLDHLGSGHRVDGAAVMQTLSLVRQATAVLARAC